MNKQFYMCLNPIKTQTYQYNTTGIQSWNNQARLKKIVETRDIPSYPLHQIVQ